MVNVETFSEDTLNDLGNAIAAFMVKNPGREFVAISHSAFSLIAADSKSVLNAYPKEFFLPIRFTAILIYKVH